MSKVRHEWYQTEDQIVIDIFAKGLKSEDIKVDVSEEKFSLDVSTSSSTNYVLDLELFEKILCKDFRTNILSTKVEFRLPKKVKGHWKSLEKAIQSDAPLTYPSSARHAKNWNEVESEVKKEEETDKPKGEAALNELFKQIYANASDETKRAMNKSYQESGGTTLSTNWEEIGKGKVEINPPEGMVAKKYNE